MATQSLTEELRSAIVESVLAGHSGTYMVVGDVLHVDSKTLSLLNKMTDGGSKAAFVTAITRSPEHVTCDTVYCNITIYD